MKCISTIVYILSEQKSYRQQLYLTLNIKYHCPGVSNARQTVTLLWSADNSGTFWHKRIKNMSDGLANICKKTFFMLITQVEFFKKSELKTNLKSKYIFEEEFSETWFRPSCWLNDVIKCICHTDHFLFSKLKNASKENFEREKSPSEKQT